MRILLIDDDEDIRLLARSALDLDGRFDVVGEGGDGNEAIRLAAEHEPDIVLLDLEMPWLDGAEAVPHIRRAVPACVIALWTVEPHGRRAAEAMALGASVLLDKSYFHVGTLAGRLWDLRSVSPRPPYQVVDSLA